MMVLHYILMIALLLSAVGVFIAPRLLYSVLLIMLCFCIAAVILFMFQLEFLAILLIMVYAGAVAVLFLFIVMMVKQKYGKDILTGSRASILMGATVIASLIIQLGEPYAEEKNRIMIKSLKILPQSNLEMIGTALYQDYSMAVIFIGITLLAALVISVSLTIPYREKEKRKKKGEDPLDEKQLAKSKDIDLFD